MPPKEKGCFITFEGIEGVGKSTAMSYVKSYLEAHNKVLLVTREPGGTPVAEAIREVVLSPRDEALSPITELLLMFAARAQHIQQVIKPALEQGQWVLCDRFTDTSYAYQGGGRGMDLTFIENLENQIQGDLRPDWVMLLDAPVDLAFERAHGRSQDFDRIEQEERTFFQRARDVFLQRAEKMPERYSIIDAAQDKNGVEKQLTDLLERFLQRRS